MGHVPRIRKEACRVAGAAQETYETDMFEGVGADFLRRVAFFNMTVSARWFRCLSGRWIENRQRDSWGDRQTDGHIHLIDKQNQTDR